MTAPRPARHRPTTLSYTVAGVQLVLGVVAAAVAIGAGVPALIPIAGGFIAQGIGLIVLAARVSPGTVVMTIVAVATVVAIIVALLLSWLVPAVEVDPLVALFGALVLLTGLWNLLQLRRALSRP